MVSLCRVSPMPHHQRQSRDRDRIIELFSGRSRYRRCPVMSTHGVLGNRLGRPRCQPLMPVGPPSEMSRCPSDANLGGVRCPASAVVLALVSSPVFTTYPSGVDPCVTSGVALPAGDAGDVSPPASASRVSRPARLSSADIDRTLRGVSTPALMLARLPSCLSPADRRGSVMHRLCRAR